MSKGKLRGQPQPKAMGHEPRFNATIWVNHPELMTDFYLRMQAGQAATPADIAMLGDFTGGLNWSEDNPDAFVPVGYVKDGNGNFIKQGGPGPTPPGPTPGAPDNYPIVIDPFGPMWAEERRTGEDGYPPMDTRKVLSIPIPIPAGPFSVTLLKLSVAQHGSPASSKQCSLSRTPGNFNAPLAFGQGNTAECGINVGVEAQPGETLYYNIRCWSSDLNAPGTDEATTGVTISGAWPR